MPDNCKLALSPLGEGFSPHKTYMLFKLVIAPDSNARLHFSRPLIPDFIKSTGSPESLEVAGIHPVPLSHDLHMLIL